MFRASIVLVNQLGGCGQVGPEDLPRDARSEEDDEEGEVPAHRRPDVAEHERPERGENAPQADAAGGEKPAERDHRQRRREQDGDLSDPEKRGEVARAREDGQCTEQDTEVHERHHTDRRPECEIQRPPHERNGQDQHRDQDQQRLPSTQVLVVAGICADERQSRTDAIRRRSGRVQNVHRGDVTGGRSAGSQSPRDVVLVGDRTSRARQASPLQAAEFPRASSIASPLSVEETGLRGPAGSHIVRCFNATHGVS